MSESSVELHPCPLCGAAHGYLLHEGDTNRWFNVLCAACHEIVAEARRAGHSTEGRNLVSDEAWNKAGAYAAKLRDRIAALEPSVGLLREVYGDGLKTNMREWQERTNAALNAAADRRQTGSAGDQLRLTEPPELELQPPELGPKPPQLAGKPPELAMARFIEDLSRWSLDTFGPGPRAAAILDHLGKELAEIEASPDSLEEWIDAAMLALDGAVRSGVSPDEVVAALVTKLKVNQSRSWPDWRTAPPGRAIEHIRGEVVASPEGGCDAQR
jgi:hypothetical protein